MVRYPLKIFSCCISHNKIFSDFLQSELKKSQHSKSIFVTGIDFFRFLCYYILHSKILAMQ